jgi:hypothetical protein
MIGTAIVVVVASAAASNIHFTKDLLEFGLAGEQTPARQPCMVASRIGYAGADRTIPVRWSADSLAPARDRSW